MTIWVIGIGVAVLLVGAVWVISTSNKFNCTNVKILEADSDIELALMKRYSILSKMIDTVKSYTKYEKETIFEIIELRKDMTVTEKSKISSQIDDNFNKINVLAENYPQLRASENFNTLQEAVVDTEEYLQAAARLYNANISSYNQMIVTFPISIVANCKKLSEKEFFESENLNIKNVKIDL